MKTEPNLVKLKEPVMIFGDIHGQFYDLLHIFDKIVGKNLGKENMLFLGDYVDRGNYSFEVIFFLYVLKICYP
jgi:serine/threonine-protein phosphatase 2B catalytic subunit